MNPKLKQVFCLCGLFWLAVILTGIKTGTTAAALLAVLLIVAISALLGCWLWLTLPACDRAEMGVASKDNYENHGSE